MEPDDGVETDGSSGSELDISAVRSRESPNDREPQSESVSSLVPLPEAVERTTPLGLAAAQNLVAANPDIDVITGADQAITGAVTAVADAGIADKVALVGYGGGAIALQGIKNGERYGTVMQMPATEGRLGTEYLIQAIRTGEAVPGVDPLDSLPDGGVVTQANVDTFLPLAEWPG